MSTVDEIKSRLDIVDVVSGYVALKKAGRNYKALCPFHTEKTASFTVTPERQSWRCFGACATGGDAFSFVMRMEKLDFGDTLRLLADKTGVALRPQADVDENEALYRINQEAAKFYQEALASPEGRSGMEYLEKRGVDAKAISAFQLGLCPAGRDMLKEHLTSLGFEQEHAVKAGVLRRSEDGSVRDFFWGRLMFPIHNRRGRVAGFGGRSMDGSDPKYINTAATPIFDKRATLYGLHMAAESIRERDTAVVVEGYMDTIAAHQHGYTNVVASMGTALTEQQADRLKSTATNFILALDPDAAGQEATLRSLESSWRVFERQRVGGRQQSVGHLYQREPLNLKIASLPQGRDPDEFIREDPKEWERLTEEAVPFVDFLIPALASRYDLSTPQGKAEAAEALGPLITSTGNAIEQEEHFRRLAEALDVSREALEASMGGPRPASGGYSRGGRQPRRDPTQAASVSPLSRDRQDFLEEYTLALMLDQPDLKKRATTLEPEHFRKTENRELFTRWLGCSTIDELRELVDEALGEHLEYLIQIDLTPNDKRSADAALGEVLRRMEQRHLREVQESLLASGDASQPPARDVEESIVSLNTRLKELFSENSGVRRG